MSKELYSEWLAAGSIALGEAFLDDEHLPLVVGSLLAICAGCSQRLKLGHIHIYMYMSRPYTWHVHMQAVLRGSS